MDPTPLKPLPLSPITPITPTWMNATLKQEDDGTSSCTTSPSSRNTTPPSLIRPFPKTNVTLSTLPTTLPLPATLPTVFPYTIPIPIPVTPQPTHLDEILAVDPEAEAARKPKKRRRTKRQRLLELQAQLEREGDGSEQHQEQAEKLLEQLNRPSGRKRRRIASELVDSEKWFCPYECGKFYRKTSTRSIYEHQVECRKKMLEQRQKEKEVTISMPIQVTLPTTTTSNPFTPTFNMTFTPNLMQHSPLTSLLMAQSFPFSSQQSSSIINKSNLFSPSQSHPITSSLPIPSPNLFTRPLSHFSSFHPVTSPLHLMRPIPITSR